MKTETIIRLLQAAESETARAAVLLSAPCAALLRDRQALAAAIGEGGDLRRYLDARLRVLDEPRGPDGLVRNTIFLAAEHARLTLCDIAKGGGRS